MTITIPYRPRLEPRPRTHRIAATLSSGKRMRCAGCRESMPIVVEAATGKPFEKCYACTFGLSRGAAPHAEIREKVLGQGKRRKSA